MNSLLGWFSIITIGMLWLFLLFKYKNNKCISMLLVSSVIYYESFTLVNVDLFIKILFLLSTVYLLLIKGIKKGPFLMVTLFCIIQYGISQIAPTNYNEYGFLDGITSFLSILTGFWFMCINWNKYEAFSIVKTISYLASISILFGGLLGGIGLLDFFGRHGMSVAGASLSTNLSFFGTVGIMAATLAENFALNENTSKYRLLKYINLIIVCSTLTRGGILSACIVFVPEFFLFLKLIVKKPIYILWGTSILLILYKPIQIFISLLSQRMYTASGEINTSGRLIAWKYILSLNQQKYTGSGLGSLKTFTSDPRLSAFTAAHNEYIRSLFETGIIGLFSLILLFMYIIYKTVTRKTRYMKIISFLIFISFLLYSYTDNTMTNFRYWIPFSILIGTILNSNILKIKFLGSKRVF